jgi:hypothetical protein
MHDRDSESVLLPVHIWENLGLRFTRLRLHNSCSNFPSAAQAPPCDNPRQWLPGANL